MTVTGGPPVIALHGIAMVLAITAHGLSSASAQGCLLPDQGHGHVAAALDGRTLQLDDGREVRLTGIELTGDGRTAAETLSAIAVGRAVVLRGNTDAPDRYGRQPALVFIAGNDLSIQERLLSDGKALVAANPADPDCLARLRSAEAAARAARRGGWNRIGTSPAAIKNAESPGDILAGIGRFMVVEGRVLTVRQAGGTYYLNFGPRWTRDFAATMSRRMAAALQTEGITVASLAGQRVRIRGFVERRGGPRIEITQAGQIELTGGE